RTAVAAAILGPARDGRSGPRDVLADVLTTVDDVWRPAPEHACRRLQVTPGDCRYLQVMPGDCRYLQVTPGDCRYLQVTPGDCRCLPDTADSSWALSGIALVLDGRAR